MRQRMVMAARSRFYTPYLVGTTLVLGGLVGWRLATWSSAVVLPWEVLALLVLLAVFVRAFAVELNERVTISLDTVVYTSSLFVLGTRGAEIVAAAGVGASLLYARVLREQAGRRAQGALLVAFVTVSVLAAMLVAASLGRVDDVLAALQQAAWREQGVVQVTSAADLTGRIALVTGTFLLLQYVIVFGRHVLLGRAPLTLLWRVFLPAFLVETAMIPLTLLAVFAYHQGVVPALSGASVAFLIVLLTYAGVVIGVRFLVNYAGMVRQRLYEMEKINRFHSNISSSLQINLLSEMVTDNLLDVFADVDGAAVMLQRENLLKVCGRTDADHQAVSTLVREQLQRRDASASGLVSLVELAAEGPGGGFMIFYRNPESGKRITRSEQRLYRLIVTIVEVAVQNARLYELATIDGLTGLYVRRYFEQRLVEEFVRARRYGENFTLVLVDLNYFKQINDEYGHLVGDEILKAVGLVLRECVRSMDVPARYGGDEFVILLPRASHEDADLIRERLEEGIERCGFEVKGDRVGVTASIGITSYQADQPEDPTQMILLADARLYEAKQHRKPLPPRRAASPREPETGPEPIL